MGDQRPDLRWIHMAGQRELRAATRIFQEALQEDRKRRVSKLEAEIETLVVADKTR